MDASEARQNAALVICPAVEAMFGRAQADR
jgi:hypothetical protein